VPDAPCYPIIYVRGYAMTAGEIDETTADPFCGFNLGSTVFRATPDKTLPARKFIFESPVLRLNTDFGYTDVFENGLDIMDPGWTDPIRSKTIVIYHYYEQASRLLASPRGKRWYLTRRIAEEDSVACRSHRDLADPAKPDARRIYLSSVFLANRWRVDPERASLAYTLTLGVRVPEFEVDRKFWPDRHYEGGYLFRDSLVLEMTPPKSADADWQVSYDWQSERPGLATTRLDTQGLAAARAELSIAFDSATAPGIRGRLLFVVTPWNR